MTGAEEICGGIATSNKNAVRGALKIAAAANRRLVLVSLQESPAARPRYLPPDALFFGCSGSKLQFARHVCFYALLRALIVFDHVTLALPVLPFAIVRWCRTVIVAHGSEADDRMRSSSRLSFRAARFIITNSELTKRRLLKQIRSLDCRVCHLGLSPDIPLRKVSPAPSTDEMKLVAVDGQTRTIQDQMILLVARIDGTEMQKGHREIIRALPELRQSFPRIQVVFPGPGGGRAILEQLARELEVADIVFFPGFVSHTQLEDFYCRCYAFVMPSKQEGFGLVYLEAMNFAKSCIGCRDDGAEEVIVDGQTGLLLNEQNDTSELVRAMSRLLADREWNRVLGINGHSRLCTLFSSESHQMRFGQLIQDLVTC